MIIHFIGKFTPYSCIPYCLIAIIIITCSHASKVSASPASTANAAKPAIQSNKSILTSLWGIAAPEPRLTLGMWSVHATKKKRNNKNDMIGVSYYGLGAGTFVNSYYKRAYAVTLQRYWVMQPLYKEINYEIGYRLGLVSGYEGHNLSGIERLRNSPVIPFVQLVVGLNWKYFGWEISSPDPYVLSTSFYIRFI